MEDNTNTFFTDYGEKIQDYIEDRLLLIRLRTVKKISNLMGQLISVIIIALLATLTFLFLSIMLGFFLGDLFNNYYAGFGTVTLLFIIALVLAVQYRAKLMRKFMGGIIDIILDKTEENDEPAKK
ncbi:MAG TPA: hypothetical protein VFQ86_13875 [Arachidicoccus soli]|uniref:Phage holin family protein n=1 Tax=Arachidicoccus soli TaxID=2341117 RepID=A0A386HRU3_9BACT|nr:hypothetical protein [Arachidicoccus soli]AYD48678.1 hypothetical protein D6B99_14345 [Arachidicoccus soli]HEU0228823.1 hypothetical protein [Arachidicoccus soli]